MKAQEKRTRQLPRSRKARTGKRSRAQSRGARASRPTLARRLLGWLAVVGLAVLSAAGALLGWSHLPQGAKDEPFPFLVRERDPGLLVQALEEQGLVSPKWLMSAYIRVFSPLSSAQERLHLLRRGLSPRQVLARLIESDNRPTVQVTLPEGWNHLQIAARLEARGICSGLAFQAAVFEPSLLRSLDIDGPSAEGYLFPARYPFRVDDDPTSVVARMVSEARARLEKLGPPSHADLQKLGFGQKELIILASIVEKETGSRSERPRVARVFLNRLLQPRASTVGRLQSDPTAVYGCQVDPLLSPACRQFSGKVTPALLEDARNPYNTYKHAGLPPGPISNPGELAIGAVLAPAASQELFFVADGQGGHTFSLTFAEHRRAVKRLQRIRAGR